MRRIMVIERRKVRCELETGDIGCVIAMLIYFNLTPTVNSDVIGLVGAKFEFNQSNQILT